MDKDIGVVNGCPLPEPTLNGYEFPDPLDRRFYEGIPAALDRFHDCFRVFAIGFSFMNAPGRSGAWRTSWSTSTSIRSLSMNC